MSDELHERVFGQRLRADAVKSGTQVLTAADRLLRINPYATLEEIALAADVSRATIYRRFPTRQHLSIALSRWAIGRIVEALSQAQIDTAPAYIALYQAARNVINVKVSLEYARNLTPPEDPIVYEYQSKMKKMVNDLLVRCQEEGIIRKDIDLTWTRAIFYAFVHEATGMEIQNASGIKSSGENLAGLVVDSLLHGVGPT